MRKLLLLGAVVAGMLLSDGAQAKRIVKNPWIETAITQALDFREIELSDTITVLHVEAYYRPRNWININKKAYLLADGKQYPVVSTEGIQLGSKFWMPDSGQASFVLRFGPLPRGVKSFDFIEVSDEKGFNLYGVDLTGKVKSTKYPAGLPQALRRAPKDGPLPEPVFEIGKTTLRVHLLGYRESMGKELSLFIEPMLTPPQQLKIPIDPQTGIATFEFGQKGTMLIRTALGDNRFGVCWIAPAEATDIYVDLQENGRKIMRRRSGINPTSDLDQIYTTGRYADLNRLHNQTWDKSITLDWFSPQFADYTRSADEYTQYLISQYNLLSDSISRSKLPEMIKQQSRISLNQMTVLSLLSSRFLMEYNYRTVHGLTIRDKVDYEFATLEPKHYAAVCRLFDINDPRMLMGSEASDFQIAVSGNEVDLAELSGVPDGLIADLRKAAQPIAKAANAQVEKSDLTALRALKNPFYAQVCEAIQQETEKLLAEVEQKAVIEPLPEVAPDQLFEAIIAPYKGKVVLVDFWNTWCSPCQAAIRENEPLKSAELQSDDLVWIYIANETSPLIEYKISIARIQGKHYRLDDTNWKYLHEKFQIDGIPSYVLVQKDGSYALRNDFRSHSKLKKTLLELIK